MEVLSGMRLLLVCAAACFQKWLKKASLSVRNGDEYTVYKLERIV